MSTNTNINKMICGRGIQYFFLTLVVIFDILYFVWVNKDNLLSDPHYNEVENLFIGQICIALIGVLSLLLSYGNRQLLYTTILLQAGLMAISIYILTILTDLPDQKNNITIIAFSYMASLLGTFGGFISISSSLMMLSHRC